MPFGSGPVTYQLRISQSCTFVLLQSSFRFHTPRAALALAKLKLLDDSHIGADPYTRILNPSRREGLVAEAAEGLAHMQRGFGVHHMLVVKMRQIRDELVPT